MYTLLYYYYSIKMQKVNILISAIFVYVINFDQVTKPTSMCTYKQTSEIDPNIDTTENSLLLTTQVHFLNSQLKSTQTKFACFCTPNLHR